MKKISNDSKNKLALHTETLYTLSPSALDGVVGGKLTTVISLPDIKSCIVGPCCNATNGGNGGDGGKGGNGGDGGNGGAVTK